MRQNKRAKHTVTVSNIGTVYEGNDGTTAKEFYNDYLRLANKENGCAAGESVSWFIGDCLHRQYTPDEATEIEPV